MMRQVRKIPLGEDAPAWMPWALRWLAQLKRAMPGVMFQRTALPAEGVSVTARSFPDGDTVVIQTADEGGLFFTPLLTDPYTTGVAGENGYVGPYPSGYASGVSTQNEEGSASSVRLKFSGGAFSVRYGVKDKPPSTWHWRDGKTVIRCAGRQAIYNAYKGGVTLLSQLSGDTYYRYLAAAATRYYPNGGTGYYADSLPGAKNALDRIFSGKKVVPGGFDGTLALAAAKATYEDVLTGEVAVRHNVVSVQRDAGGDLFEFRLVFWQPESEAVELSGYTANYGKAYVDFSESGKKAVVCRYVQSGQTWPYSTVRSMDYQALEVEFGDGTITVTEIGSGHECFAGLPVLHTGLVESGTTHTHHFAEADMRVWYEGETLVAWAKIVEEQFTDTLVEEALSRTQTGTATVRTREYLRGELLSDTSYTSYEETAIETRESPSASLVETSASITAYVNPSPARYPIDIDAGLYARQALAGAKVFELLAPDSSVLLSRSLPSATAWSRSYSDTPANAFIHSRFFSVYWELHDGSPYTEMPYAPTIAGKRPDAFAHPAERVGVCVGPATDTQDTSMYVAYGWDKDGNISVAYLHDILGVPYSNTQMPRPGGVRII